MIKADPDLVTLVTGAVVLSVIGIIAYVFCSIDNNRAAIECAKLNRHWTGDACLVKP